MIISKKGLILGASLLFSLSQLTSAQSLIDFDKGQTVRECLINCRSYHREELNLPHGAGKGMCWNVCSQEFAK